MAPSVRGSRNSNLVSIVLVDDPTLIVLTLIADDVGTEACGVVVAIVLSFLMKVSYIPF